MDWQPGRQVGERIKAHRERVGMSFDHLRRTVEDYRKWARPVNEAKFRAWRKAAVTLATETDDPTAFVAFADIKDALEPMERQVMKLALDVDIENPAPDRLRTGQMTGGHDSSARTARCHG